jgi:hypothetical protein
MTRLLPAAWGQASCVRGAAGRLAELLDAGLSLTRSALKWLAEDAEP